MYRQLSDPSVTCPAPGSASASDTSSSDCALCAVRGRAICAALSAQEMDALDQVTHTATYTPGSTLVRSGETRHNVYTVTSGALRMVRTLADGRRQITGFVLPGDYVGLTETAQHRHDIEAIVDSRVCRTPMAQMRHLRERYPQLERKLLQRASMELAAAQDTGLLLARLQPSERLAHFLLRLAARSTQPGAGGDTVALPMSRSDIADHLGLTVETVSRTFTKLRQQQLIALPQLHLVQILDDAALRSLAGDTV
ncbi:Crp/Fnr family transcriptional regulator [Xanthomonas prunicola]|jgi:CRP/FNR family transcriptional regulator|uniref:CRP-like protein Clp n=1 Tax=Xanthomonas prunicola TaxID=2053930 RepID=A0A2N3RH99_9XANT|nr:Crp/Fnr family transcriptional regulator [Xanthomonas prunicola]PKV16156.1 Crp/Fnr family transcriptional regulator [Xanthomonas prunicola]PKV20190.1 Crp/Fnr family transcriptional regulator [Xanthomonas prunicola]